MNLYIMTRGRVGKQYTLSRLPEKWKNKTYLVCPHDECEVHDFETVCTSLADRPITNYSQKFQWILDGFPCKDENGNWYNDENEKAVILDDDLVFSKREGKSLKTITDPEELNGLFEQMETLLDTYPLVGVHPRQMGQDAPAPFVLNGRIICMQGINRRLIGKVKVDQFPILADVVLNLTILARGQRNAIITSYFQDHGPCQAAGGCSIYRTSEMQTMAVQYLANRFPGYVKVVARRTKDKWLANEAGIRYDYTSQWKKLYRAGAAHVLDPGTAPNPDKEGT